jgi:hypothetical protein
MARTAGGRIAASWLWLAVVMSMLALPARARAQTADVCPRVPAGLRCAPLPRDGWVRHEALQALDAEGRRRVGRGDYGGAAQVFGCLVEGDPTPESAGNLAVVLREHGDLGDALLIARCAEDLAPPGPTRDRARTRREELEHRLGLPATTAREGGDTPRVAPPSTLPLSPAVASSSGAWGATPGALVLSAPPAQPPQVSHHRAAFATLAAGAAALIAGGVLYALARDRTRQFDEEQQSTGFTDRARTLRSDAQNLQTASWLTGGAGVAAAAVGGILFAF